MPDIEIVSFTGAASSSILNSHIASLSL